MPAEGKDIKSRFQLLYDLGCAFAARLDLDELVPLVVAKSREVLDAEGAAVLLFDRERHELYFPYVDEENPAVGARLTQLRFPADRGIAGAVLRSGKPLRVDDATTDPRFYENVDRSTGRTTRSMITAPLSLRDEPLGVIQVLNRHRGVFDDDDLAFLEALAAIVGVTIENARVYAQVKSSEEQLRAQVGALRRDLARRDRFDDMIGAAPAMVETFRLMESAAASPIAVLVEGETGTGKELVARGIHRASARASEPFVAVNCAALVETLLERELFGHRRGAFTGAFHDQRGLFEAAAGGTIFLDEVAEMPPAMQAKLLRVLQEGEIVPVGDTRPRRVDVRVISATNRDLEAAVRAGEVRADLYYRLAAFPIRLPPLRERREDIPLLADHALAAAARRHGKHIPGIESVALELLMRFHWPGNVRELENEIERGVALARDGENLGVAHLSTKLHGANPVQYPRSGDHDAHGGAASDVVAEGAQRIAPLRRARAAFEARYLAEALRHHDGNVSRAALALGVSRVMLHKKMKEYGIG